MTIPHSSLTWRHEAIWTGCADGHGIFLRTADDTALPVAASTVEAALEFERCPRCRCRNWRDQLLINSHISSPIYSWIMLHQWYLKIPGIDGYVKIYLSLISSLIPGNHPTGDTWWIPWAWFFRCVGWVSTAHLPPKTTTFGRKKPPFWLRISLAQNAVVFVGQRSMDRPPHNQKRQHFPQLWGVSSVSRQCSFWWPWRSWPFLWSRWKVPLFEARKSSTDGQKHFFRHSEIDADRMWFWRLLRWLSIKHLWHRFW